RTSGHPHVHEDDVDPHASDRRDHADAVSVLEDDFDAGVALEDGAKPRPDERFVVDEGDADRGRSGVLGGCVAHGAGMIVVERTCPSAKHTSNTSVRSKGLNVDSWCRQSPDPTCGGGASISNSGSRAFAALSF